MHKLSLFFEELHLASMSIPLVVCYFDYILSLYFIASSVNIWHCYVAEIFTIQYLLKLN